jgi:hypothetical protein
VHDNFILESVFVGDGDGPDEVVLLRISKNMQTLPIDFHDFDKIDLPYKLVLALRDHDNCLADIRHEIGKLAN